MRSPTEISISSHRPLLGRLIVGYKKLVGLLVAPYLRTVFEQEHRIVEERMRQMLIPVEETLDGLRADILRLQEISRDNTGYCDELLGRIDSTTRLLNEKIDELSGAAGKDGR